MEPNPSQNPSHDRLIDFALGDISREEEALLYAQFDRDPALREQAERIRRNVLMVRAVPANDISEAALARLFAAVREAGIAQPAAAAAGHATEHATEHATGHEDHKPGKILSLADWLRTHAMRIAAAVVVSGAIIFGLSQMPELPAPSVARISADGVTNWVHDGELVEAAIGDRRQITFQGGEVLLDGASAVRLHRTGDFTAPMIEVVRGRAVLSAGNVALNATAAEQNLDIEAGSSVAVDYERPYQSVSADGRMVEVQRQTLAEAAALGERTYGIRINVSELDAELRNNRRVSFYGTDMTPEVFVASLAQAASRYGIHEVALNTRDVKLVYKGGSDSGEGVDAAMVNVAVLAGNATVSRQGESSTTRLSAGAGNNGFSARTTQDAMPLQRGSDALARMVVWAGGMGNNSVEASLREHASRGGSLPRGTVIHSDRVILIQGASNAAGPERVFLLGGPEFTFPLPGDRMGRLVGLMSTGAEFEVKGELKREFIPLSALGK